MLIIRFFHFVLGYVVFRAQGGFPERFINLCAGMGIPVWDIKYRNGIVYGKTGTAGYKKLRHAARKSGMKISIVRRVGLPFFLNRYRRRVGLLIGLGVFVIFMSVMSSMVWTIDISGNEKVSDEAILSVFEQLDVKPGVRSSKIKVADVERNALSLLPRVQWLAVNINGSNVTIEIREKIVSEKQLDYSQPHHIAASKTGVIETLECYEGTSLLSVGSAVEKGDLIIRGITDNLDGSVEFHHAKGYVVARTKEKITVSLKSKQKILRPDSTDYRITLRIAGIKIPPRVANGNGKADYYESSWWLYADERRLPVGYTVHRNLYYKSENVSFSRQELLLLAQSRLLESSELMLKSSRVESQKVAVLLSVDEITMTESFELLENIGQELPFKVEENEISLETEG